MDLNIREKHKKSLTNTKILVVEDNPLIQIATQLILKDLGCHFDIFSNGEDLFSVDWEKYHLLFLNIRLPDISGIELAKKIRALELSKNLKKRIPIIAYTSCGKEIKEECIEAGFDDFLFKPAKISNFKRLIQRLPLAVK